MFTVRFQPEDRSVDVSSGTPLSVAAAETGFVLRNDCGGNGTCGKCKVYVDGRERLACRVAVESDLDVRIPETSLQGADEEIVVQDRSFLPERTLVANRDHRFGVALDIGTTTLAAELFELSGQVGPRLAGVVSRTNPQRIFGDDIITRIQKVVEEPDSLGTLQGAILDAVNGMFGELAEQAGIATREITLLSVAGNTVMEYLFLGIDPSPMGFSPFIPPKTEFPTCSGRELGLALSPEAVVEVFPIFGGFVGGDLVAGVLATELAEEDRETPVFLIDIGTNGELVFRKDGEFYVAATAAGPAFEGGRIEYGMSAVPGAVDRVELREDGSVRSSTIGHRPATGICGSALIDAASELLRFGLIKPTGQFNVKPDSPFLSRWKMVDGKPAFVLVPESESGRNEAILLTQRDVRQLQLATGAIRAGIRLLLGRFGLDVGQVGTFYVAGGFGSFIRPESARRIGLLPSEIPLERIRFCGNTSLAGARLALFDPCRHEESLALTRRAQLVELATQPNFAAVFAECMLFE